VLFPYDMHSRVVAIASLELETHNGLPSVYRSTRQKHRCGCPVPACWPRVLQNTVCFSDLTCVIAIPCRVS
jgi:hypothetical protein